MNTIAADKKISFLSRNAKVKGEISGNESIVVEGFIKGAIVLKGDIVVEDCGIVEASIEAINVTIKGKVIGKVTAREQLLIESTGKLLGDFSSESVNIREGAVIEGHSHMISSSPKNYALT